MNRESGIGNRESGSGKREAGSGKRGSGEAGKPPPRRDCFSFTTPYGRVRTPQAGFSYLWRLVTTNGPRYHWCRYPARSLGRTPASELPSEPYVHLSAHTALPLIDHKELFLER